MKPSAPCLLATAAVLALSSCEFEDIAHGRGSRFTEDFREERAMPPGGRLSVENMNGPVEIAGWDRDRVEISGTKYASTEDALSRLKVEIHDSAGIVEVRTVRSGAWSSWMNGGVRYRIQVPRKTRIERVQSTNGSLTAVSIDGPVKMRTTNGAIKLTGVSGEVEAGSTNGSIRADGIRGRFVATTTNGAIDIVAEELTPGGSSRVRSTNGSVQLAVKSGKLSDIEASTTNGAISVRIPEKPDVRVRASTSTGRISTDFALEKSLQDRGRRLEAAIGSGGPLLELKTTNGGIRIEKF